jgi:hypothetical protein
MSIKKDDLVVAVESAKGAGPVMGICQPGINAWESYRHDDPDAFDYAHTVCFPVLWIDWDISLPAPPKPPAMIAGVQEMGVDQSSKVETMWKQFNSPFSN